MENLWLLSRFKVVYRLFALRNVFNFLLAKVYFAKFQEKFAIWESLFFKILFLAKVSAGESFCPYQLAKISLIICS